jgi:hypothetical protein
MAIEIQRFLLRKPLCCQNAYCVKMRHRMTVVPSLNFTIRVRSAVTNRGKSVLRRAAGEAAEIRQDPGTALEFRQHDPLLRLILTFAIGITGLADLVGFEEYDLAEAFVGINAGR